MSNFVDRSAFSRHEEYTVRSYLADNTNSNLRSKLNRFKMTSNERLGINNLQGSNAIGFLLPK